MSENYELPINLDDLPNYILKNTNENDYLSAYNDSKKANIARKFLLDLQLCILSKDERPQSEIFALYDLAFNKISQTHFNQEEWPNVEQIEKETSIETQIDVSVEYLYQELCYRHVFARLQNITKEARLNSWENYKALLQDFSHTSNNTNLPPSWIWDTLDEFIYQYSVNLAWKNKNPEEYAELEVVMAENKESYWNNVEMLEILDTLIKKSKIMNGNNLLVMENPSTIQYFGFFALISKVRLLSLTGDFEAAIEITKKFRYEHLTVLAKAYGSYMTLFYFSGVSYFMTRKYKRSLLVLEALAQHISSYKQFFSKSFQYENILKIYEKSIHLIALAYVFSTTKLEKPMESWVLEKLGDKMDKLKRFDVQTLNEVINFGMPRFIDPVTGSTEANLESKGEFANDYLKIQKFSDFNCLLNLYSKISLDKAAKFMGLTNPELQTLISQFNEKSRFVPDDSPFESTILKKIIKPSSQKTFQIENNEILVEEYHEIDFEEQLAEQNKSIQLLLNLLQAE